MMRNKRALSGLFEVLRDGEYQIIMKFLHYKQTIHAEKFNIEGIGTDGFLPYEKQAVEDFKKVFLHKGLQLFEEKLSKLAEFGFVDMMDDAGDTVYSITRTGMVISYNLIEYDIQITRGFIDKVTAMIKELGGKADSRVLDIGCGAGQSLYGFARVGLDLCLGIDLSLNDLLVARVFNDRLYKAKQINLVQADALCLPLKENSIDMIFTKGVFMLLDRNKAIKEVCQVLSSGGIFAGILTGYRYYLLSMLYSLKKGRFPMRPLFSLFNGLLVRVFNIQLSLKGNYNYFETSQGLKKFLEKSGFLVVSIQRTPPGAYTLDSSLFFVAIKRT